MESALESLLANHSEWIDNFTRCQGGSGARDLECISGWGQETWSLALKYAYTKNSPWDADNDVSAVEVVSGDEIDEAYYASRIPIVKQQLIAGGIRLAATLENIFNPTDDEEGGKYTERKSILQSLSMESIRALSYVSHFQT
jgi:hypothetical protein